MAGHKKTKPASTGEAASPLIVASNTEPAETGIRIRAHEVYLSRAGGPGDAVSDWLQAERELRGEQDASNATPA